MWYCFVARKSYAIDWHREAVAKVRNMERGSRWPLVSLYPGSFTSEVVVTRGDGWACETGTPG